MIGQRIKDNPDKRPNSRQMDKLKKEFPEFFTKEGEFKIESFQKFLGEEEVDISKEGYELNFLGKSYAKYVSSLETETYISPDSDHNSKEANKDSENLYIVGDNIDALKHLLGSYAGKIKCIYIDPPYNTGSDGFVYPDNFQFNAGELSTKIGITEEEGERILDLEGKSTHSAWLTFMYPRLVLARDLLTDDGVIFISIDDNEQGNLRLLCDEVFGEENFIANFIWQKTYSPKNNNKYVSEDHDFIICYSKDKNILGELNRLERDKKSDSMYKYDDNDGKGKYRLSDLTIGNLKGYDINWHGKTYKEPPTRGWAFSEDRMYELIKENRIYLPNDENKRPAYKRYLSEVPGIISKTILPYELVGHTQSSKRALDELLGINIFSYPKPVELIKYFQIISTDTDSIVLDFFSGSATTADAVMQLNAEDGGSRKYIMVQLPEKIEEKKPAYKAGYRTIDEIGRARIEKAAAKIREETDADIDYGYKLYYLEKPSEKTLVDLENFEPEIKLITDDMVSVFDNDHSTGKESILATWLNEDGYGLSKTPKTYKLEDYEADLMEKSLYIIDEGLEDKDVLKLIKDIESDQLDINRVVVYVYSLTFNVLQELRKNLKVLRNNKNVTLIERF